MAVLKTYTLRASAAVWHSDSDAMTWLPVHAVADRRYAWLRATSTRARIRLRIQIFNGDRCAVVAISQPYK